MANQAERKIKLLRERVEDIVTGFHPISRKPLSESSDLKDPDIIRLLVQILVELYQKIPTIQIHRFRKIG